MRYIIVLLIIEFNGDLMIKELNKVLFACLLVLILLILDYNKFPFGFKTVKEELMRLGSVYRIKKVFLGNQDLDIEVADTNNLNMIGNKVVLDDEAILSICNGVVICSMDDLVIIEDYNGNTYQYRDFYSMNVRLYQNVYIGDVIGIAKYDDYYFYELVR